MTSRRDSSDPVTILEELKTFYGQLYRSRSFKTEAQCCEYLKKINTPHLSSVDIDSCEGKLSMKECFEALTAMHLYRFNKIIYAQILSLLLFLLYSFCNLVITKGTLKTGDQFSYLM